MGNLVFQATLGGQVSLVGPNTASTFTLNVPAVSSTLATLAANTFTGTQTLSTLTSPAATNLLIQSAATTAITIDTSQNVGVGVTPSAWGSSFKAIQIGRGTALWSGTATDATFLSQNAYYDGSNFRYLQTAYASYYSSQLGQHLWYNAPSGTAGNTITFTQAMMLDASGNLGIGTTSPNASAILDAQSTTKGVRMPNMTTTQKNAISSPAAGLLVFDTTLAKLCVYSGSAWQTVTSI